MRVVGQRAFVQQITGDAQHRLAHQSRERTIEDRLAQCERLEAIPHEAVVDWLVACVA